MDKKMVKKLTPNNVVGTGITRVPENDWKGDDGSWYRAYSYKGVPIDQLCKNSAVYIYVYEMSADGLELNFTTNDWRKTEECRYLDLKYAPNGGMYREFDICELTADIDKVLAKIDELNKEVLANPVDRDLLKKTAFKEIDYAEEIWEKGRKLDWYNLERRYVEDLHLYLHWLEGDINRAKDFCLKIGEISEMYCREYAERIEAGRCMFIDNTQFSHLQSVINIINKATATYVAIVWDQKDTLTRKPIYFKDFKDEKECVSTAKSLWESLDPDLKAIMSVEAIKTENTETNHFDGYLYFQDGDDFTD